MGDTTSIFHHTGSKKLALPTRTMVLNYLKKHSYRSASPYKCLCAYENLVLPKGTAGKGQAANASGQDELKYFGIGLIKTYILSVPPSPHLISDIHMAHADRWLELQTGKAQVQRQEKQRTLSSGWKKGSIFA